MQICMKKIVFQKINLQAKKWTSVLVTLHVWGSSRGRERRWYLRDSKSTRQTERGATGTSPDCDVLLGTNEPAPPVVDDVINNKMYIS